MAKQTVQAQECACPTACKLVGPILMIVFGVIALVRELKGQAPIKQEA